MPDDVCMFVAIRMRRCGVGEELCHHCVRAEHAKPKARLAFARNMGKIIARYDVAFDSARHDRKYAREHPCVRIGEHKAYPLGHAERPGACIAIAGDMYGAGNLGMEMVVEAPVACADEDETPRAAGNHSLLRIKFGIDGVRRMDIGCWPMRYSVIIAKNDRIAVIDRDLRGNKVVPLHADRMDRRRCAMRKSRRSRQKTSNERCGKEKKISVHECGPRSAGSSIVSSCNCMHQSSDFQSKGRYF